MNILKMIREYEAKHQATKKPVAEKRVPETAVETGLISDWVPEMRSYQTLDEPTRIDEPMPASILPDWYQSDAVFSEPSAVTEPEIPYYLQTSWDNPDELHRHIKTAIDHFIVDPAILAASKRLLEIDDQPERAIVARASALFAAFEYAEAEIALKDYLATHAETPHVLLQLAKAYDFQGKKPLRQTTLQKSLSLDPNFSESVDWCLQLERIERSEYDYTETLTIMAANEYAWYAQLLLATDFISQGDTEKARPLLRNILKKAVDQSAMLSKISTLLSTYGQAKEMIRVVLPVYNQHLHDVQVGYELLQACVETQNKQIGLVMIENIRATNLPWLDEAKLQTYTELLNQQ